MSCDCVVKNTNFINEMVNVFDESTVFEYDLSNLISSFNPKYSGIWQPVFFYETPVSSGTKKWYKVNTVQNEEECESSTPNGLGIKELVSVPNPKLRNWEVLGDVDLQLDWIVDFTKYNYICKEYSECVLFWYRYYDMGRPSQKEFRLFPGIDLYVSDGDMAVIDNEPVVTPNLSGTFNQIRSSLLAAGFNAETAKYNASVLSTGPQIDRLTEILSGPNNGINYERTDLGLLYPQLSGMSQKRYSDIGKNNYIVTKVDLLEKLNSKYGTYIAVPEASEVTLKSNFLSSTGPNIKIKLDTETYVSNDKQSCAYDISYYLNNQIKLKAYQSDEIFTVTTPVDDPEDPDAEPTIEIDEYKINYVKFGDKILGYHLSEKNSGIFNPDINTVKFHGLGGVDFDTSLTRDISCVNSINSSTFNGPYFSQKNSYTSTLDGTPSNIFINIKTYNNTQIKFMSGIYIEYLRSESKPTCESFIENNDTCKCFSLMDTHPEASGKKELSNADNLLFIPSTSMYHLPSGKYYAGLSGQEVGDYGIFLPDHPSPGTSLPKNHDPIFPIEESCTYTVDGCGNKTISFNIDYPGELFLSYESTEAHFTLRWDSETIENEGSHFDSNAGSLCLTKTTQSPSLVYVDVEVPESDPDTEWAISLSATQTDYAKQTILDGLNISAKKGFFHPNFGWTYDPKYLNKTPIIPNHNGLSYLGKPGADSSNYKLYVRYSNTDGPCPGGHVCNRAKFNVYANGVLLGIADLNNAGGAEDSGQSAGGDRSSLLTLPTFVRFRSGQTMNILIECAYETGCHGGIAWVQIINNKGELIYNSCINTDQTITLNLEESLNSYFYNSYAMYKEEYLPGYNFMYTVSGLSEQQKNKINDSTYLGIKTAGNSYYVNNNFNKIKYNLLESMVLDNIPFEYINMDHTYGYAYNDFFFTRSAGSNILTITSSSNPERIINYFDDPSISSESLTLISSIDYSKKIEVLVTDISKNNQIQINKTPDDDYFLSGYITKTRDDGQYNQSVLVYRPHITHDDKLTIGKWGNMSYGYAGLMAARYNGINLYRYDKLLDQSWYGETLNNQWFNNSVIRNGITENTSHSWGCPVAFVDSLDKTKQTNFYPMCRLFNSFSDNNDRRYQILNYEKPLEIENDTYLDGDKIISKGSIREPEGYIYLGALTQPLKIKVKLNIQDANAGFLIFKYKNVEIFKGRVEDVNEDDEIVIDFNKKDVLPIYGQLIVEKNPAFCAKTTTTSDIALNAQVLFVQEYLVEVNLTNQELLNTSRISYYQHEPDPKLLGQSSTNAINDSTDILKLNKQYVRNLNKDFNPFLDLHIFEKEDTKKPIVANSGIVYFEDFFQPKSQNYLLNEMETPYNEDLYWIDMPLQGQWGLLTQKGILLTQNTTYKILKKLEYKCEDDATTCSEKYPKNICEENYEITKGDIYNVLGLIGSDQNLIEISEVSFPAYCETISHCCKTEEECNSEDCEKYTEQVDIDRCYKDREICLSDREDCLEKEQQSKDDCNKMWKEEMKYDISCKDICPTGMVSGVIEVETLEYYLLKVKSNLNPPLNNLNNLTLTFLPQSDAIDIPCSDISFSNIGATFLYNYNCSESKKDCQTIIPLEYDIGSEFIDGTFLDLSILENKPAVLNTTPTSVIIDNEIKYRKNIPHKNIISLPFYEYDPHSTSKYIITHNFTIKSKECVEPGDLFTLSIDNLNCDFSLNSTSSGLVLESSCFDDVVVDPKSDSYLTVYKTICEGKFNCSNNDRNIPCSDTDNCEPKCDCQPLGCEKEWSCDDAAEYLKTINSNYELIKCEEITLPEDYYLACRQCSDAFSPCQTSIYYSDPLPEECYCPPESTLIDHPDYGKICEFQYKISQLKQIEYKDYFYIDMCETEEKTITSYVLDGAICFPAVVGPSKEALEDYEKGCDGTEFVSKTSSDQVISIDNNGVGKANYDAQLASQKENYRVECEFKKLNETLAKCVDPCQKSYSSCVENNGGVEQCHISYSSCVCPCYASYYNGYTDVELSRAIYYTCFGNCNISDSIQPYFSGAWGWWWYCGDDVCDVRYTAANTPCNPERCCPDTSCEYNSCQDLEKRIKFNYYSQKLKCEVQEDGSTSWADDGSDCEPRNMQFLQTVNSSYTIKTREVTTYSKTKKKILSQKESMDNTSTVKVFNKEYKLTFKNNEDCDPACENNETCCDGECISEDEVCCEDKTDINISLVFEIYDNLIVGIINNNQYNKIYHERSSVPFKCPKINFEAKNDKLYMCNTVSSECLNCFAGAKNV